MNVTNRNVVTSHLEVRVLSGCHGLDNTNFGEGGMLTTDVVTRAGGRRRHCDGGN